MITDTFQANGQWSLNLTRMPAEVEEKLSPLATLLVTPSRVSVEEIGATAANASSLYAVAQWGGVVMKLPVRGVREMSGYGMAWWLGDESRGIPYNASIAFAGTTLSTTLATLIPADLTVGTITNPASAFVGGVPAHFTPRKAFEYVCTTLAAQWRVNPNATVDAAAALYPGVSAIAVRQAVFDVGLSAFTIADLSNDRDVEDYITEARVVSGTTYATASQSTTYKNPQGASFRRVQVEQETGGKATLSTRAAAVLALNNAPRKEVRLSLSDYRLHGTLKAGSIIGAYDPLTGLTDTANPVEYMGDLIYPAYLEVKSLTWPVTDGMGVYSHVAGQDPVDISEYVEFESGDTTLEVGAAARPVIAQPVSTVALAGKVNTIASDVAAQKPANTAEVVTLQTTASTTYADLASAGPAQTVTIGPSGKAMVIVSAVAFNSSAANRQFMGFAVSGASTVAASDDYALRTGNVTGPDFNASRAKLLTGLAEGSTTFTAKYRTTAGTASFSQRSLIVVPLI